MTTSVFYPASAGMFRQSSDANGTAARMLAREITQPAAVGERVFASGSGSTTMTSGTLTNTPTSGDVLIAVLYRRADGQTTITNPAGWTKLTAAGTTSSRTLEVWWYRSTGVVGDKGSFAWTVTSATGAWGIDLLRITGSGAAGDPVLKTAATAFASTTTPAAVTASPTTVDAPGMTLTCIAITGASLGAGGIAAAFSGTGTAEATTLYYDSTYGAGACYVADIYDNASFPTYSYGSAYTLTAARAGHQAVIQLNGGGASTFGTGVTSLHGAGMNVTAGQGPLHQSYLTYDTSAIPDNNTITSATLQLRAAATIAGAFAVGDPANAALQARYYGTAITDTRGFNNNHWAQSPTAMSALTLVATYPAASAWTAGNDYALTSTASFATSINKTGNTVLLMTTDDFASANARTTSETYAFDVSSTFASLTVVHTFQASATVTTTVPLVVTITRRAALLRTIAVTVNLPVTVARVAAALRTIATSTNLSTIVSRAVANARTISTNVPELVTVARQTTINRIISTSVNLSTLVTRAITSARTITTNAVIAPTVNRLFSTLRTITSTVGTALSVTAIRVIPQAPRILRLTMRSTIKVGQTVTARLRGRSTIRLPKETR